MLQSSRWDKQQTLNDTLAILRGLATRHARMGGTQGKYIWGLLKARSYDVLCTMKLDPDSFGPGIGIEHYRHCRQALAFFQKLDALEIGVDKEKVAWDKFVKAEASCRETNGLFRQVMSGGVSLLPRETVLFYRARESILRILGERPPQLSELRMRFGPGATTTTMKKVACPQMKMAGGLSCSSRMLHSGLLYEVVRNIPHWAHTANVGYCIDDGGWLCERVEVALGNGRLAFVPKNAQTHRAIVTEPTLNGFVQLGIGDWMTDRLRAFGIDLRDQTINQGLAREGSLTGELATLDLVSASDTISRELVRFLLPPAWYRLLDSCRSDTIEYKGEAIILEKFSSMGNGFSFPLESLIFWSLTRASVKAGRVSIYGDDIICPSRDVVQVTRTLTVAGFEVNLAKSFWSATFDVPPTFEGEYVVDPQGPVTVGGFRESCGRDYYFGFDTRPFYQKELISGASLFCLHNFYVRWDDQEGASVVLGLIPKTMRLWGPPGYGDGHLVRNDFVRDARLNKGLFKRGFAGYYFETYRLSSVKLPPRFSGDYVSPLYQCYVSADDRDLDYHPWVRVEDPVVVPEPKEPVRKDKKGFPLWVVPGVSGYERVKIYAFG